MKLNQFYGMYAGLNNSFKHDCFCSLKLEVFRNIRDSQGAKLLDNYRPTLPLAGRKVTEYDVVEMQAKPRQVEDKHKPMPDTDYDEVMNILEPNRKKEAPKKNGASTLIQNTNSLFFGLSIAASAIISVRF